ncbi:flippase [Fulvivirga sediminis]|uniref:Flippase n=1 Tax=Fulvivirga sediminis TaxID=2803949 RepID=A0A937K2T6_9BACT|nr:flippase [Fulvivirga sediminis]MBL3658182.1 flippase [Fulvivirga sediminis]
MKKLLDLFKTSRKSYWVRSGTYTLLGRSSNLIFGFVNFLVLVRALTVDELGTYTLFMTICTFMELIKGGFIGNPLIQYSSTLTGNEYTKVISASLFLNICISLLQVVVILVFAFWLSDFWSAPELKQMFIIYAITYVINIPLSHMNCIQQANFDFKGSFYSNFFRQLIMFSFILSYLFGYKYDVVDLSYVQLVSIAVALAFGVYFGKQYFSFDKNISKEWLAKLWNYGKYTFGTNVSSNFLRNIDSWMLAKMISPLATGFYNPAIRLGNLFEVPTTTLTSIAFPKLVQRIKNEGEGAARHLYEKSTGYIFAIMLPVVSLVVIFADYVVLIIAGEGFEETVPILRITMLYGLIVPFNRQFGITLSALGKPHYNFYFVFGNAIVNTILNYFFIKQFGLIGAALATLTTFLLTLIYNQYYIHNKLNVKWKRIFGYSLAFYKVGYAKAKSIF